MEILNPLVILIIPIGLMSGGIKAFALVLMKYKGDLQTTRKTKGYHRGHLFSPI
jgi:hypothetical protein